MAPRLRLPADRPVAGRGFGYGFYRSEMNSAERPESAPSRRWLQKLGCRWSTGRPLRCSRELRPRRAVACDWRSTGPGRARRDGDDHIRAGHSGGRDPPHLVADLITAPSGRGADASQQSLRAAAELPLHLADQVPAAPASVPCQPAWTAPIAGLSGSNAAISGQSADISTSGTPGMSVTEPVHESHGRAAPVAPAAHILGEDPQDLGGHHLLRRGQLLKGHAERPADDLAGLYGLLAPCPRCGA